MEKIHDIELRLSTNYTYAAQFRAMQGDTGRKLVATLYNDDGTEYPGESGVTAEYWSRKPDGTGTQHSAAIAGNVVTVSFTAQDLAAAGRVYATIVLKKAGVIVSSMPFWFEVMQAATGENVESSNNYQNMIEATEAANEAAETANLAATHGPYIDENTYYWYVWDETRQTYVNTGVVATGAVEGAVLYVQQTIPTGYQAQARENIHAGYSETQVYFDSEGYLCFHEKEAE